MSRANLINYHTGTGTTSPGVNNVELGEISICHKDEAHTRIFTKSTDDNKMVEFAPLLSGITIKTINNQSIVGGGNITLEDIGISGEIPTKVSQLKNDVGYLTKNGSKTINNMTLDKKDGESDNLSLATTSQLNEKQDKLISSGEGKNLKKINNIDLLGTTDITLSDLLNGFANYLKDNFGLYVSDGKLYSNKPIYSSNGFYES